MNFKKLLKNFLPYNIILNHRKRKMNVQNKIPSTTILEDNVSIMHPITRVGEYTYIGPGARLENIDKIGRYCSISHDVKIGLAPHPTTWLTSNAIFCNPSREIVKERKFQAIEQVGYTSISHDVWIGSSALIMAGVKIGTGAIIGAGSVITKDIPPYAIVVGVPGKVIKYRFPENVIEQLLLSEWWKKEPEELIVNEELVYNPENYFLKNR